MAINWNSLKEQEKDLESRLKQYDSRGSSSAPKSTGTVSQPSRANDALYQTALEGLRSGSLPISGRVAERAPSLQPRTERQASLLERSRERTGSDFLITNPMTPLEDRIDRWENEYERASRRVDALQSGPVTARRNQSAMREAVDARDQARSILEELRQQQARNTYGGRRLNVTFDAFDYLPGSESGRVKSAAQYLTDPESRAVRQLGASVGGYTDFEGINLGLMTEEEKNRFLDYVEEENYASAAGYLDSLERTLNARRQQQFSETARRVSEENPAVGTVANLVSNYAAPAAFFANLGQGVKNVITGEEEVTDYNSPWFTAAHLSSDTREGVSEAASNLPVVGDIEIFGENLGSQLANAGLSIGQNLSYLPFGAAGALAYMGASAAGQTTTEALERGASSGQALALGALSGAVEAATEKIGIDRLFSIARREGAGGIRRVLLDAGIQAATEGAEEAVSEAANTILDAVIMADNSNFALTVTAYEAQGMSKEEAEKQAFMDALQQVGAAAFGGALSGGIMVGGASILSGRGSRGRTAAQSAETPAQAAAEADAVSAELEALAREKVESELPPVREPQPVVQRTVQREEPSRVTEARDELDQDTAEKVDTVAKALGLKVHFVDRVQGGTVNAQISGNEVQIERGNPNPVMFLLGHEWTHRLQEAAPSEYQDFRNFVSGEADVQAEASALIEQARIDGYDLDMDAAMDEAVANYAGRMINEDAVLDDFIERHRQDRTLLQKIRDAIRSIIDKLTGAEKRRAQTAEGKLTAAFETAARQSVASQQTAPQASRKGSENAREVAALRSENRRLRESVERWRAETRRSRPGEVRKRDVSRAASDLVKEYGATVDRDEIADDLLSLYNYIGIGTEGNSDLTWTETSQRARSIAEKIADSAVAVDEDMYQDYKELRDFLRNTDIRVSASDQANIQDFSAARRRNASRVRVSSGHTNIDQVYQDLSSRWPEWFDDAVIQPEDQMARIFEVSEAIYSRREYNPFENDLDRAVDHISNEIIDRFFDLPQLRTFADREAARLERTKAEGRRRLEKERAARKEDVRREREAGRKKADEALLAGMMSQGRRDAAQIRRAKEALSREKERNRQQLDRLRSRHMAQDAAKRDRTYRTNMRRRIERHASSLSTKLLRPTDTSNIPDSLRTAVSSLLDAINLESAYTVDPETGKRIKGGDGAPTKRTQAFQKLREQYAKIAKSDDSGIVIDPDLLGSAADGIDGAFDKVISYRDIRLSDMTAEQIDTVWKVIRSVEHSIQNAGKILTGRKYDRSRDLAEALQRDSSSRRQRVPLTKGQASIDLETPYTFFSQFGPSGMDIFRMLRDAQDQQEIMIHQADEAVSKIVDTKTAQALRKERHTFETAAGDELTLTTAQIMSLYELSKRPQAQEHLYSGGIVQPPIERNGTQPRIDRGSYVIKLTREDVSDIVDTLDDSQKKIADGLQGLMSGMLSEWGNQASMHVYGYRKFTEENYWPISVAREGIYSTVENGGWNERSIKNIGMAKSTVPDAKNPLNIGDAFLTFAQHLGDMADYAAFLAPMEDATRLFNFRFRDANGTLTGNSIKNILTKVGGPKAQAYWTRLMNDIQNGTAARVDSELSQAVDRAVGNVKAAAVGANLRVILQQPTAYFRASLVLDADSMTKGLTGGATKGNGWQKALKYAPIAQRKADGGFDISNPARLDELLFGRSGKIKALNDFSSKPAALADEVTWGKLWNACEWQVKKRGGLKLGTDEFYESVSRLFTDVIDQTQVVDGVLQRSQAMRSENAVVRQATSFMGEPTMTYNILLRAYDQVRYSNDAAARKKALRRFARAGASVVLTSTMNAIAQSLADGLRDDDPEKKYLDRVAAAFTGVQGDEETAWERATNIVLGGNLANNLNVLGMIPYGNDVLSILQGYTVERMDASAIADLIDSMQQFSKNIGGNGPKTRKAALKELTTAATKVFGISIMNVVRDAAGIVRSIAIETENIGLQYEIEKSIYNITSESNMGRFLDIAFRALQQQDYEAYETITSDMMDSLIVDGKKMSGETIERGMRSRLTAAQKEDPELTFPQHAMDLIGATREYGSEAEEEGPDPIDTLNAEQYKSFSQKRGREYRSIENALDRSRAFRTGGFSSKEKDAALSAASDLAMEMALESVLSGRYQTDKEWMQWAKSGYEYGVSPDEAILFRTIYNNTNGEKEDPSDPESSTIPGSKKENVLERVDELMPQLTGDELDYLESFFWKS